MYNKIGINWLSEQGYCEYKLVLRHCKGLNITSADIEEGIEYHKLLGDKLSTKFESEGSKRLVKSLSDEIKTAIDLNKDFSFYQTNFKMECDLMIGEADEFTITNRSMYLGEHKSKPITGIPFYGDIRQTLAYGYCVKHQYPNILLPISCFMRDKITGEIFWSHLYETKDEIDVLDATHRSLDIVNGKRNPIPASKIIKCIKCNYHLLNLCDKDLTKK